MNMLNMIFHINGLCKIFPTIFASQIWMLLVIFHVISQVVLNVKYFSTFITIEDWNVQLLAMHKILMPLKKILPPKGLWTICAKETRCFMGTLVVFEVVFVVKLCFQETRNPLNLQ